MDTIAGCLTLRSVGSVDPLAAPGQKTETWEKRRKERERILGRNVWRREKVGAIDG